MLPELITEEQFTLWLLILAIAAPVVGGVVGLLAGLRGRMGRSLLVGFLAGLLGPLAYVAWLGYLRTVAVNTATGEAGLHKVSVFLLDLLAFVVVGVVIGLAAGRLRRRLLA